MIAGAGTEMRKAAEEASKKAQAAAAEPTQRALVVASKDAETRTKREAKEAAWKREVEYRKKRDAERTARREANEAPSSASSTAPSSAVSSAAPTAATEAGAQAPVTHGRPNVLSASACAALRSALAPAVTATGSKNAEDGSRCEICTLPTDQMLELRPCCHMMCAPCYDKLRKRTVQMSSEGTCPSCTKWHLHC